MYLILFKLEESLLKNSFWNFEFKYVLIMTYNILFETWDRLKILYEVLKDFVKKEGKEEVINLISIN